MKNLNSPRRCKSSIKGRRILINFSKNCCQRSQPKNCDTALETGGFDVCIMYNENVLDEDFKKFNDRILSTKTGGGLWLWKPYIILKTMLAMKDDDVLMYTDSGTQFIDNVDHAHICLMQQREKDVVVFSDSHPEYQLTKPDAFILMGLDPSNPKYSQSNQLIAAFFITRKSFKSIKFLSEFLTYAQDYRIISNDKSTFGKEPAGFRGHRNDQSIESLLSKKYDFEIWPDPSQYGEDGFNFNLRKSEKFSLINRTFFAHTRDKS